MYSKEFKILFSKEEEKIIPKTSFFSAIGFDNRDSRRDWNYPNFIAFYPIYASY
jgi:hypothetical protein